MPQFSALIQCLSALMTKVFTRDTYHDYHKYLQR